MGRGRSAPFPADALVPRAGPAGRPHAGREDAPGRNFQKRAPRTPEGMAHTPWGSWAAGGLGAGAALTLHGLDLVGDVEAAQRGERAQEGGHVGGALETLGGGLRALPVVDLQVDDGAAGAGRGSVRPPPAHQPPWGPDGALVVAPRGPRGDRAPELEEGRPGARSGQERPWRRRPQRPAHQACHSLWFPWGLAPRFPLSAGQRPPAGPPRGADRAPGHGPRHKGRGWGGCPAGPGGASGPLPSSGGNAAPGAAPRVTRLGLGSRSLTRGCPSGPAPCASARPRRPGAARP